MWSITTHVNGNGAIDYQRQTPTSDTVTFTVIPAANHHFVKYVIYGYASEYEKLVADNDDLIITLSGDHITVRLPATSEHTDTPLTITLIRDTDVTAYFEEDDKYHISASADIQYASIYVSHNDDYGGYTATLWARPFPDYNFVRWSNGSTTNPITITVNEDVTMVAEYQRITDTNGIYQYRCFIKDQLDLEAAPKAFMVVDTFDIRTDLMTNAKSTINVMELASNINEGDILVLYDPMGNFLYNGVIVSIQKKRIGCSQMQSFYKGTWIYNVSPQSSLEKELAVLLQDYADGKLYGSTYTDALVAQRLGGITIRYTESTTVNLPTDLDDNGNPKYTTKNMEKFMYELYEQYGIIFKFEINLSGTNYVDIEVPSFEAIKVGNNMYAIQDMSPITKIDENNKLVIYNRDHTYRTTYIATKNGIVENPATTANRFNITNTKVVFSDDASADLVAANLPQTMFNHKIEYDLIIKNFIYQFGDFHLGGTLDIYYDDDYYNSVLTGYQIKKASNQNITEVHFVCGKVRTALTKIMTLGQVE